MHALREGTLTILQPRKNGRHSGILNVELELPSHHKRGLDTAFSEHESEKPLVAAQYKISTTSNRG